jgi:hypothetical protein
LHNPAANTFTIPPPQGGYQVKKIFTEWKTYRTRFLVRAHRLDQALTFVDVLGREHRGRVGDYLVESSDGSRSITPRAIFEDIYVAMEAQEASIPPVSEKKPSARGQISNSPLKRSSSCGTASA